MALEPAGHAASSSEDLSDKVNPISGLYCCVVTVNDDSLYEFAINSHVGFGFDYTNITSLGHGVTGWHTLNIYRSYN